MVSPQPAILECIDLRKEYPGVVALDDVSLRLGPGELRALVGENGAGKSTLVKIIAGQTGPDSGRFEIAGAAVQHFSPHSARKLGITMVPQHPDLFHSLTALENLFVGDWPRGALGTISWREMRRRAEKVLAELGVSLDLDEPVAALSVAERQLLQIARALLVEARVLIFDEPTAPLGQDETERLFALIRRLHERGVAMIYISHRLAEVFELAETVTVLRDGKLVDTRPMAEVSREELVRMMVGEEVAVASPPAPLPANNGDLTPGPSPRSGEGGTASPALLNVDRLTVPGKVEDASFQVAPGEIVGIAGVAGSGRNELLRALACVGATCTDAIRLEGQPLCGAGPRAALQAGISMVPADRHHEALVLPMTIRENLSLGSLRRLANVCGLVKRADEKAEAQALSARFDVRSAGIEQVAGTLSGGNQQKVALASRLATDPKLLLLEEPTQGVDVKARAEIHRQMHTLAETGVGIVLVSSDLPELLSLSDRVLVMHRGKIVGDLTREEATQERVLDLALGTAEEGAAAEHVVRHRAPMRELGLAALLLVLGLIVSWRAHSFATVENLTDILVNNAYLVIAGVGMTMVILTAGIDISVGSILAACATVAATTAAAGYSVPVVLVAALVAGLALGAINSGLITGARIPPIIATLATLTLYRHVLIHLTGGKWINLPAGFREFGLSTPLGIPVGVWVAVATGLGGWAMTRWTPLGRSLYAVGCNEDAAAHMGISVRRVQASVYLLMGLLVGLAAFVYAGHYSAIQTNAGGGFEMVVITAVVVGGTNIFGGSGTILGTVIGVLLLGLIAGSLTHLHIEPAWEKAFQGALILTAVVVDTLRTRKGASQ